MEYILQKFLKKLFLTVFVFTNTVVFAQNNIIGVVSDSNGISLPGSTVLVKRTQTGVSTDFDGNFEISAKSTDVLVFSFVGYITREITVGNKTTINVTLQEDVSQLEEVVIVGYGTQKKINLTGAVETINLKKDLGERPSPNITTLLQGSLPGLTIGFGAGGGEPGASQTIRIRGTGTLTGNGGNPYILLDGFPIPISQLNALNPEDIEDVTVLKDAAASAIYGSRGAFGVILITTKKGALGQKTQVKYSSRVDVVSPTSLPEMANGLEFANAYNVSLRNVGRPVFWNEDALAKIEQQVNGELPYETEVLTLNNGNQRWANGRNGFANNNWWDVFFRDNSIGQQHNVSISGGEKKTKFYLAGTYFLRNGNMNFVKDDYYRFATQANISHEVNDWLSFEFNSRFSRERRDFPNGGFNGFNKNIIYHQISRSWITNPAFAPDGSAIDANILRLRDSGRREDTFSTNTNLVAANLEPIKNWKTRVTYSWKIRSNQSNTLNLRALNYFPDGTTNFLFGGYPIDGINKVYSEGFDQVYNITSQYNFTIKDNHNIAGMVGYEQREVDFSNIRAQRNDLILPSIPSISTAVGEQFTGDGVNEQSTQGVFARLAYNYKQKYLIEFNARADGSSFFRQGKQWGFFPSLAMGYNISEEKFWKPLKSVVNNLKFKVSHGELGNHDASLRNLFQELHNSTTTSWIIGGQQIEQVGPPSIVSNSLTWETVTTSNLGLEAGLFDNKLSINFDLFRRVTSDMIGPTLPVPNVLGSAVPRTNNAELTTEGWEANIKWRQKLGDFSYRIGFNVFDNTSEVTKYYNPDGLLSTFREGQILGDIWGFVTNRFYTVDDFVEGSLNANLLRGTLVDGVVKYQGNVRANPGDILYKDLNDDGLINTGDGTIENTGDRQIIGNSRARYNYGVSAGVNYKGFDLSFLVQGVAKRDFLFGGTTNLFYGFRGNQFQNSITKASLDYWTPENLNAYFPRPYFTGEHTKNTRPQTKYLQDASYIRLKNIQFSYTIPKKLVSGIGLKIYYTGENLFTITDLNENFDPEALGGGLGAGKVYPLNKTHSIGVNISL